MNLCARRLQVQSTCLEENKELLENKNARFTEEQ